MENEFLIDDAVVNYCNGVGSDKILVLYVSYDIPNDDVERNAMFEFPAGELNLGEHPELLGKKLKMKIE